MERLHIVAAYGKRRFAGGGVQTALKFPPAFNKFHYHLTVVVFQFRGGRNGQIAYPVQAKYGMDSEMNNRGVYFHSATVFPCRKP